MAGCDACDANIKAELESKDEDQLSDQEKAILEGEADTPTFNGPLSPADVDYCEFCHGMGQLGAIVFAIIVGFVVSDFVTIEIAVGVGVLFWLILSLIVGYAGRFPVLGALFGPIVEKLLAIYLDIYVTEKAKKEYGSAIVNSGEGMYAQPVENRLPIDGTEMHLVASPWALETCADMDVPGALKRVEVENGQITDIHSFHGQFNRFRMLNDHVGYRQFDNVCQAYAQNNGPTTIMEFSELISTEGEGGIE